MPPEPPPDTPPDDRAETIGHPARCLFAEPNANTNVLHHLEAAPSAGVQ